MTVGGRRQPVGRRLVAVLGLAFGAANAGCAVQETPPAMGDPALAGVAVPVDEPAMQAAIAEARAAAGIFVAVLADPRPGQAGFAVKVPQPAGDAVAHVWLEDVAFDGSQFRGRLAAGPPGVAGVQSGQEASVPAEAIVDWRYVERGVLVGGRTLRVLREHLSAADRAALDARLPFRFE